MDTFHTERSAVSRSESFRGTRHVSIARACERWKEIVGEKFLHVDELTVTRFGENVSGLSREIAAVLQPASTQEVQEVVRVAHECRIPLYPISRGCNWGLGSRLPVRSGAVLLDLSRLNRIHEVNAQHHYAVVEPGVTQGQLYDYLCEHHLPLMLNVTGAGRSTSLIGNALERGIGYFSSRADSLSGMEVVMGNGEILRTGFGSWPDSRITHHYKHGIGPGLDSLFVQSNLGIVTRAGVELLPAPEAHAALIVSLRDETKLGEFINRLADLRRRGAIQTVIHVGNRYRTEITLAPLLCERLQTETSDFQTMKASVEALLAAEGFGSWSAVIGLLGTSAHLQASLDEVKRELSELGRISVLTDLKIRGAKKILNALSFLPWARRKSAILDATEPLYGLSKGIPTDAALGSLYWPIGELPPKKQARPDRDGGGMLYFLPMMPLEGNVAVEMMDLTKGICDRFGFQPATTLNVVDTRTLEAVISLSFDRRKPDQVKAAHDCMEQLHALYVEKGYPPYRVGIQSMNRVVDLNNPFWKVIHDLKHVFDPHHIIAPGRYNLL